MRNTPGTRIDQAFLQRFPSLAGLVEGIALRMKMLAPVHLRALWRQADLYEQEAFLRAARRAQDYRRFNAEAVRRILEAGFQAIESWIEAIDQYAEGGGALKDLRQRIADAGLTVESAIGFPESSRLPTGRSTAPTRSRIKPTSKAKSSSTRISTKRGSRPGTSSATPATSFDSDKRR